MRPEPLPWGRKDFYKECKHERSNTSSYGSNHPRWRDYPSSSYHYAPHHRWGGGGSNNEFRRLPGHGKQDSWHMFGEESGHIYAHYRYSDRLMGDQNFRPSVSRGDGRHGRNSRDNRGPFGPRDWKGHSWEMSNVSSSTPGRLHTVINEQRPVDSMLGHLPSRPPHSDFVNTSDQIRLNDQHNNNKMAGIDGSGTAQKGERESSMEWRPLKWTRSGSMGSRGSGFSHSSSSKSLGSVDSNEGKTKMQKKSTASVQSSSGDVATGVISKVTYEQMMSKKKRLGWGEGLAKYEKKKVDGPDEIPNEDGVLFCNGNIEHNHSQSSNLGEKSPTVNGFPECLSPVTPSSIACSSSPGAEDITSGKSVNVDNEVSNLCVLPGIESQSHPEGISFNLEKMDATLSSSLAELLQSDELSVVNSLRSSAMNKLLIWKGEISKALEVTESEIDLLENELKSMKFEYASRSSQLKATSSFPAKSIAETCIGLEVGSNSIIRHSPLQSMCSEDEFGEKVSISKCVSEGFHAGKDDDIDSPGTATSKLIEPVLMKSTLMFDVKKHVECLEDLGVVQSRTELKPLVSCMDKEETNASICIDDEHLTESNDCAPSFTDLTVHANAEDSLHNLILISNKEDAAGAAEVFNKLLPRDQCKTDFGQVTSVLSWHNDSPMRKEFSIRKQFLKLQEQITALKFKTFQQLWKEDMSPLSVRKYRAKSQKKCEVSLRTRHCGYQKHRSRSRFNSSRNISIVSTAEILNFASKLLSESQVKNYRSVLKMPALILDKKERVASCFVSSNGLVEDPCAVEKERAMINPWTSEEREIFMDKLATFGKDFRKIAAFLDHKSTADCVEFYYKNHKSDSFEKTKKSKEAKSSTNYLVASNKKFYRDLNAASLDILGAASVMAADVDNGVGCWQSSSPKIYFGRYKDFKPAGSDHMPERQTCYDTCSKEKDTAACLLTDICDSIYSEAVNSCITTSVDPVEGYWERKCQKVDSAKPPSTSDVSQNIDEETCSDESCGEMDATDWTDKEKSIFIRAVSTYGKDFAMISRCIRTRSQDQCKVFFSKARKCLGLDSLHPVPRQFGMPVGDDANGGVRDMEDALRIETGSVVCNSKVRFKVNRDLSLPVLNPKYDESVNFERTHLHADLNQSVDNNVLEMLHQEDSKTMETSVCDAFKDCHRPELTFDVNSQILCSKELHDIAAASVSNQAAEDEGIAVTKSVAVKSIIDSSASKICDSDNGIGDQFRGTKLLVPDNCTSRSVLRGSDSSGNICDLPLDVDKRTTELNYLEKPSVKLLQHKNGSAVLNSLMGSADISIEKVSQDRLLSTLVFQENTDKQGEMSVSRDDSFQNMSSATVLRNNDSSQVTRCYPLQMPGNKEMNENIYCGPLSGVPIFPNSETHFASQLAAQDGCLKKCNSLNVQRLMPELTEDHSQSVPKMQKPCKNGGVKLFGTILNNPLHLQNVSSNNSNGNANNHSKYSSDSSSVNFTGHQFEDGNTALFKGDHYSFAGCKNVSARNCGSRDGKRIRTGYSSSPNSSYLLPKYSAAFSDYQDSSSKIQPQTLQTVIKDNDSNSTGISVFTSREICGSNVDQQMYRGNKDVEIHPFTVDSKQPRDDLVSQMQRVNGCQGRNVVGVDVVGREGVVVGGPCTGISDPVAAIRLHFAKNGGQNRGNIREESWRGTGDLGR